MRKIYLIAIGLIALILIGSGIAWNSEPAGSRFTGLEITDTNSTIPIGLNNTSIGINLLTTISLYGFEYTVQANSSQNTPILRYDTIQIYAPGSNQLVVEYEHANLFNQTTFTNHIDQHILLPNMNGTTITVYLYSSQYNATFTVIYEINVMTISNYRTYVTNHLTPQPPDFTAITTAILIENAMGWFIAGFIVFLGFWYFYLSTKSEHEGGISLFDRGGV